MLVSIGRSFASYGTGRVNNINSDAFEKDADELIFIPEVDRFDEPAYQVVRSQPRARWNADEERRMGSGGVSPQ